LTGFEGTFRRGIATRLATGVQPTIRKAAPTAAKSATQGSRIRRRGSGSDRTPPLLV